MLKQKSINIFFSISNTLLLTVISIIENYTKEELIAKYVKEKEVLFAIKINEIISRIEKKPI